ncbi:hypothetical protein [Xanthomonas arboricola]|uniref:hypothetical protein n=1 Tax=Xanthomonas arboricola TaxID=56448 RepID=UPI0023B9B12F|nr:hypothetical protein [Xanthomonas arboricola]
MKHIAALGGQATAFHCHNLLPQSGLRLAVNALADVAAMVVGCVQTLSVSEDCCFTCPNLVKALNDDPALIFVS